MREELEKLVAAGKINNRQVPPLLALLESGFCQARSWGFGRITALDTTLGRLNIDFTTKAGHSMDLAFAAESLRPIPRDHLLVRKNTDLAGLKQEAALHHLEVVKLALRSLGGRATADQVMALLVPDVVGSDWKKWWYAARAEMRRDGHFTVPLKKTDPIVYNEEEIQVADRLATELRAAKGLKARIAVAGEMLKCMEQIRDHGVVSEAVGLLNAEIQSHLQTMSALSLEGMFVRDELRQAAGLPVPEADLQPKDVWKDVSRLAEFFAELPATRHRRALESFRDCLPDWGAQVVLMLNDVSAKLAGESARLLLLEGRGQLLKDTLARLVSQHQASSELLLWLGKERGDHFADILGPEVFRAMLTAMERDAFNERKSSRLHDFILEDQDLLPELIASADVDVIKDLVRTLQLSPAFDDMDKRSLLARIVKPYPVIQSMITGDQKKEDQTFLVSWASLERRKDEYEELVKKKIPANSKDIALARSYGDLRENHEYKSAKEMQRILNRRKAELEAGLARARGTDFAAPRTDVVSPGTVVQLTDLGTGTGIAYSLRGAWDGDPDRHILSYLSPLAQSLMNQPVGTEVTLELDGQKHRYRIDGIRAWQAPSSEAAEPAAEASSPETPVAEAPAA
ncbi:MAG: GreA/GreB family elongation factor [Verrucomicrobiota bacterium]